MTRKRETYDDWWPPEKGESIDDFYTEVLDDNTFHIGQDYSDMAAPTIACNALAVVPCYAAHMPWWAEWVLPPMLLAFAVNHLAEIPTFARKLLELKPLRQMGLWSYSIYLWQHPYYQAKSVIGVPLALISAIATGLASYYFLEKPVRQWLNEHWKPGGGASVAAEPLASTA